jgi:hypothetical protein
VAQEERRKTSNFAFRPRAFRSLSPPEARFRQNAWESVTRNRVPKYAWLSGASQGVTDRSFDGASEKRVELMASNDPVGPLNQRILCSATGRSMRRRSAEAGGRQFP